MTVVAVREYNSLMATTKLVLVRSDVGYTVRFVPPLVPYEDAEAVFEVEGVDAEVARRVAKAVAAGTLSATVAHDELVYGDQDYPGGCECELDYNCYIHRHRRYTAIELQMDAWASQDRSPYPWD